MLMHTWRKSSAYVEASVALTIGNFDGVHLGHQAILTRLKIKAHELGLPACVMTFEPHPREFFVPTQAPTRLTSLREKMELLAQAGADCIHICHFNDNFARISCEQFITRILNRKLSTRWLLVGNDFRFGARRIGDIAMLQALSRTNGFEVEVMPNVNINGRRISSTGIRKALDQGDLSIAKELLGRPYSISGRVIKGDQLGQRIGFPTANINLKNYRPPLSGIFVVLVHGVVPSLPQTILPGVASLGVRPTTHEKGNFVVEVHLLDFEGNIYGQQIRVDFLHKLRNEEKYPNINILIQHIKNDIAQARNYLKTTSIHLRSLCGTY